MQTFKAIVSGNAPEWVREVATPREVKVICGKDSPKTAFAPLAFSDAAISYTDSLRFGDFRKGERILGGLGQRFWIGGWHADPSLSHEARRLFEQKAAKILPDADGRKDLLQTVSGAFAGFASAINRAHLRFVMTVLNKCPKLSIHEDAGQDYTAGIVLNEKATIVFPPGSCPRAARQESSPFDVDYDATRCDTTQGMHMPLRSLGAWRGEVPHSVALGQDMARLGFFAFADAGNETPARPENPTRLMRLDNWFINKIRSAHG